jgi:hypothetical protein
LEQSRRRKSLCFGATGSRNHASKQPPGFWTLGIRITSHWNALHLPKIAALEKMGGKAPVIGPTRHWAEKHKYLLDSARLFGFDQGQFLPPPADHFEVDKLAYVSTDMMDGRLLRDVRTRIWGKTQPVHATALHPPRRCPRAVDCTTGVNCTISKRLRPSCGTSSSNLSKPISWTSRSKLRFSPKHQ